MATRSVARSAGLDFLPLTRERFDLVMRQRDYFMKGLFDFMRLAGFGERASELGGYDISEAGAVRPVN
jgi:putative molybdopterin biosynthesis protein